MKALLWPRPGERLLPVISALILALSYPPLHLYVPPFVGLVPFAFWIGSLPADADGRRAAVRGSLLFGLVYFGIVFYWILVALIWFTWLAIPAFLASLALLTAVAVLVGWGMHRAIHGAGAPVWIAVPALWTAGEWFRAHWPDTLSFPWLGLGTSFTGAPELVGIAEVIGARGVTLWMAVVNALLAAALLARGRGGRWIPQAASALAICVLPMAWGVWRAQALETRPAARVAVVQPNIPEHIKLDRERGLDSTFTSLDGLMWELVSRVEGSGEGSVGGDGDRSGSGGDGEDSGDGNEERVGAPLELDLVVMPEVVLPGVFPGHETSAPEVERLRGYAQAVGAPIVFGGIGHEYGADGRFTPFNSAFLVTADGLAPYRYDKRHLVPIVERVPFLPASLLGGLEYFGIYGVGEGWPLVEIEGASFAPLICYESAYAYQARAFRQRGADVLLNLTNDAWYGRAEFYARTSALWQHPAHMVMRAIENRVGVARAANTGISLFVDPIGRVAEPTELFTADVRVHTVETTDVLTIFARYGDVSGGTAAVVALLLVATSVVNDRRRMRELE